MDTPVVAAEFIGTSISSGGNGGPAGVLASFVVEAGWRAS
jgi:hypothetical protein